ncbi:MAG: MBL fold metallo-hydrolase [Verrucomicrobiales bacterium]
MELSFEVFTGGFCQTNAYLLKFDGRHVLVDAPDDAAEWLTTQNVNLDALLLTHQHFDHVMDAAKIKAEQRCPVYAWSPPSPELWLNRLFSSLSGWSLEVRDYEVDHLLDGLTSVALPGINFELLHVPGHSPDSVCFYHAPSQSCFSGDTVFHDGIGRTDFPGGSQAQLLDGIRQKLLSLPDGVALLPGHGCPTTVSRERRENAFLRAA